MNVFDLRQRLVEDYARYTRSFLKIADTRIIAKVDGSLDDGAWPDPLIQLNPTFEPCGTIDDLLVKGILHLECSRDFPDRQGRHRSDGQAAAAERPSGNRCSEG